jgi:hypothetical protein
MEKKCCKCKTIKNVDEFYNNKAMSDGKQFVCIDCNKIQQKHYAKIRKEKNTEAPKKKNLTSSEMNLLGLKKDDFCEMYSALSKLGYNLELDIHTQFCEKWGLKVSKSPRKGKENTYTYQDCIKKPD